MNRRLINRRGFASFIAVVSIAAVGIALAAIGADFARQVRRTQRQQSQTQLRQLLLAGAAQAGAGLQAGSAPATPSPLDLPAPLADALVTFHVEPTPQGGRSVTVTAAVGDQSIRHTLTFRPTPAAGTPQN